MSPKTSHAMLIPKCSLTFKNNDVKIKEKLQILNTSLKAGCNRSFQKGFTIGNMFPIFESPSVTERKGKPAKAVTTPR